MSQAEQSDIVGKENGKRERGAEGFPILSWAKGRDFEAVPVAGRLPVRILIGRRCLDEGIDVPEANVGIALSGTAGRFFMPFLA